MDALKEKEMDGCRGERGGEGGKRWMEKRWMDAKEEKKMNEGGDG